MKLKYFPLRTLAVIMLTSSIGVAQSHLTLREDVVGYQSGLEAKYACAARAELYLKKYEDVICEPTLKTNIRTLRWNSIVADEIYAGKTTNVHRSTSSYSSSGSDVLTGEIVTYSARLFASIASTFSSSSSSSSSSRTETPVYSTVHKAIPQYRDEVVETYGYRLITSSQAGVINASTENGVIYQSNRVHTTAVAATIECQQYAALMMGYRILGRCDISDKAGGTTAWTFSGKNHFNK